MKTLLFFLVGGFASALLAQPAGSNNVEIVWSATNDWSSSLWVYKAVPQVFSPPVISNLLSVASFTMAENQCIPGSEMYGVDSNGLYFATPDEKRHLGISPKYGYIEYEDPDAKGEQEKKDNGVPTDEDAYPLALDYLRKFGIDRSQLATEPSTNSVYGPNDLGIRRLLGSHGWNDTNTHKMVVYTNSRGIFFIRQVDGVMVDGITHGGVTIVFGEQAGVSPHYLHFF